jgi:hypothetical protein
MAEGYGRKTDETIQGPNKLHNCWLLIESKAEEICHNEAGSEEPSGLRVHG